MREITRVITENYEKDTLFGLHVNTIKRKEKRANIKFGPALLEHNITIYKCG